MLAQAALVLHHLVLGLGWSGVLYTVNVVQSLVLLVVAVVLAARRRLLVLLVPVVSVVLGLALQATAGLPAEQDTSPAVSATRADSGGPAGLRHPSEPAQVGSAGG